MALEDILDMTVRELLDKYCAIYNLECGYYYGITDFDTVEELFHEYNIDEEYPEAFNVELVINDELMDTFDEVLTYERLVKIMDNLGITPKTEGE